MFTRALIPLIFCITFNTVAAQETSTDLATKDNFTPLALDTIVVTTQKREQAVQEVPISMMVLNEKSLEKARGNSLADIQQLVPGFSLKNQSGSDALTIRGVGGGGRNIGFDPACGSELNKMDTTTADNIYRADQNTSDFE